MNIAELAIRNGTTTWTLSLVTLVLGWFAFQDLPRLENAERSIREARVVTSYPGVSAAEVEQEVSDKIAMAVRELDQLRRVETYSSRGLSVVKVVIQDRYDNRTLPQIWDDLRRKIDNAQQNLPPGAGPSVVDDDLGDLYGTYYALIGEGFTPLERRRVAEMLQRELSVLNGVKQVILFGEQQQAIFVEVSMAKAKAMGLALEEIFVALTNKNPPADAGRILVGPEDVPIFPGELYSSAQDLGDILIAASGDRLVRLRDVAEIRRDYEDPPRRLLRVDGLPAVGIAVSIPADGDRVTVAETVERRLAELTARMPLGMELKAIALQSETIEGAIDVFTVRFALAVALVLAVLLLFMGLRNGLIVGCATLLAVAGTFVVMDWFRIALEPVSFGSLIITVGLIPGNAILVAEDMKLRMDQGLMGIAAAREVAAQNTLLLLGTTAVAALSFAAVGDMDSSTGEQLHSLYWVVLLSLAISWVSALTAVPLLCDRYLQSGDQRDKTGDPFTGYFYRLYAQLLAAAIRRHWLVLGATALLFLLALYGWAFVSRVFFPSSINPGFLIEVRFREGTDIGETERRIGDIQTDLSSHEGITQVATAIGDNHPNFPASYEVGLYPTSNYSVSLVKVDDDRLIDVLVPQIQAQLEVNFPDAVVNVRKFDRASMSTAGGRIQVRISGPNPAQLRHIADEVKAAIATDPETKAVRDDWGAKIKVARLVAAQDLAHRLQIDRTRIATALHSTFSGTQAGFYREGTELVPIIVRAVKAERGSVEDMAEILVTSPLRGDQVPMRRLVDRMETRTEDARRSRRDGIPTITVHADTVHDLSFELLERIKLRVEKALKQGPAVQPGPDSETRFGNGADTDSPIQVGRIPVKGRPGYYLSWGGEAERFAEFHEELLQRIPSYFVLMVLILVGLFNAVRQPLMVLLTLPLLMIGVTAGLLLSGRPFDIMSLVGLLGLSGMQIRNATLLVDQIDREVGAGKVLFAAILHAAHVRLRPVGLAAGTSILALLPLLQDDLFSSLAMVIISGVGIATLFTLVVVPVLYATLFSIESAPPVVSPPTSPMAQSL